MTVTMEPEGVPRMSFAGRMGRALGEESTDGSSVGVDWVGVMAILGFWAVFGTVMTTAILRSFLAEETTAPWELAAFHYLAAFVWALLTLPLLSLTRWIDLGSRQTGVAVALVVVLGLVTALMVSILVSFVSSFFMRETLNGSLTTLRGVRRMIDYRYSTDVLAALLILTAGITRDFVLRYRSRQEEASLLRSQLSEARVEHLRSQLDPHVLFNTLNAVAALVTTDPKGVRRMIAALSELLRYSLGREGDLEIPLRKEIELARHYLDIIEIRYQGQVKTQVVVDPETMSAMVPSLVLQPLVENAMKHGVGPAGGRGMVTVTARREEDDLVLGVEDSGGGSVSDAPPSDWVPGLGLRLTEERLKLVSGASGSLRLYRTDRGNTRSEIRLPFRSQDPDATTTLPDGTAND